MTIPSITALPAAPQRTDAPSTFVTKADAFVAALANFGTQTNASIVAINGVAVTVSSNAATAAAAATAALASTDFRGAWADATGSATAGGSYSNGGQVWALIRDVANIALSEPAIDSADWSLLSAIVTEFIGDVKTTSNPLASPEWLPCDNLVYLQSSYSDLFSIIGLLPDSAPAVLSDPPTPPGSLSADVAINHDNTHIAVLANDVTLNVWSRSNKTFTKLNVTTVPGGGPAGLGVSDNAEIFLVSSTDTPFIRVVKRVGSTLSNLADPSTLPSGASAGAGCDPTGTYLAVSVNTAPFVEWFKRVGDTVTKLPDYTGDEIDATCYDLAWDGSGRFLFGACGTAPKLRVWERTGDTLAALADPTTAAGQGNGVTVSRDGNYVAVVGNTTPFFECFKNNGGTLTALPNPDVLSSTALDGVDTNEDGSVFICSGSSTTKAISYSRKGSALTKLPDLPAAATNLGANRAAAISDDGTIMVIGASDAPRFRVLTTAGYNLSTEFAVPILEPGFGLNSFIKAT